MGDAGAVNLHQYSSKSDFFVQSDGLQNVLMSLINCQTKLFKPLPCSSDPVALLGHHRAEWKIQWEASDEPLPELVMPQGPLPDHLDLPADIRRAAGKFGGPRSIGGALPRVCFRQCWS